MKQLNSGLVGAALISFIFNTTAAAPRGNTPEMIAGRHCLSRWNASNSFFIDSVKAKLRNPRSFVHVRTDIGSINAQGVHFARMKYRFEEGGVSKVAIADALIDHRTCHATLR